MYFIVGGNVFKCVLNSGQNGRFYNGHYKFIFGLILEIWIKIQLIKSLSIG